MSEPREPGWQATLDQIERSVADRLAELDRYEAAFTGAVAEPTEREIGRSRDGQGAALPDATRPLPDRRGSDQPSPSDTWDARLVVARTGAEEIDRLLAGAEAGWARWREAFSAWHRGLQQPPNTETASTDSVV